METARISIQVGSTVLNAEGTEAFVRDAIELWERFSLASICPASDVEVASKEEKSADRDTTAGSANLPNGSSLSRYDHVFDSVDGRLKIIAHIGGKTKAEQTRQVALLILFGHTLLGNEHIASEAIRAACIDQGCYDPTNFAGYLRGLKQQVVMNPKTGGQYDIKLTAPGRKAAKELADKLQASEV